MTENKQAKWSSDYNKKNTKTVLLRFNLKSDSDILEQLDKHRSKQGYIKELIRNDMKKGG